MEVWNGGWADVETDNEGNIAFWTDLLDAGLRLTGIAGTDSHGPKDDDDATLGFTYVYATEPSEAAILDGIRRSRVFLSRGPTLSFRATGSDGTEVRLPGAELPADGALRLTVDVERLDRMSTIWFVTSGSKVPLAVCEPGATRVVDERALVAAGGGGSSCAPARSPPATCSSSRTRSTWRPRPVPQNVTGRDSSARSVGVLIRMTGPLTEYDGIRRKSSSKAIVASSRASGAPRQ